MKTGDFRAFGDIQSYFVLLGAQHQWTIVQAGGLLKNRAIPMGKELQPYSVKCRVCRVCSVEGGVWSLEREERSDSYGQLSS